MIVTGVADDLEPAIQIESEAFSDVYDIHSEVGRYVNGGFNSPRCLNQPQPGHGILMTSYLG